MSWDDFDDDDLDDGERELTPEEVAALVAAKQEARFEPKPYKLTATKKIIAVVDTETDPFAWGVSIRPFTLGFYDGQTYRDWWGDNCVQEFFDWLKCETDDYLIYAHNGGKFDFHFFLDYLEDKQNPLIIGGRMVKIEFAGQEFRDSYSIIPRALGTYKKDDIDYANFVPEKRELFKREILDYQKSDCVYLHELVSGFHDLFGDKLTVASAALPMLHSLHGYERIKGDSLDKRFRQYYFGGRNQCFETGVLRPRPGRKFYVYDRNSMYPAEMREQLHPISALFHLQNDITEETDFACIVAKNDGALPMRQEDDSLDFTVPYGTFHATIHEIRAGLDTGTLRIDKVKHAWRADRKARFDTFVDQFYGLRLEASAIGDEIRKGLYKDCLNSPYGKFALNPRKFKQWLFTTGEIPEPQRSEAEPNGWTIHSQSGDVFIWCRPNPRPNGFHNVATAASITGAARANLLRNLALSDRPVYCDTDSIICEGFRGDLDPSRLGGWKLEAEGDIVAIAGKKLYAVKNSGEVIKSASKGVRLTADEIIRVCNGEEIIHRSEVPNFQLGRDYRDICEDDYTVRRVNKTGVI